jgi:hypothetical protein
VFLPRHSVLSAGRVSADSKRDAIGRPSGRVPPFAAPSPAFRWPTCTAAHFVSIQGEFARPARPLRPVVAYSTACTRRAPALRPCPPPNRSSSIGISGRYGEGCVRTAAKKRSDYPLPAPSRSCRRLVERHRATIFGDVKLRRMIGWRRTCRREPERRWHRWRTSGRTRDRVQAAFNGFTLRLILAPALRSAMRRSYSDWRFSQNSALVPKQRARRSAGSAVTRVCRARSRSGGQFRYPELRIFQALPAARAAL